MAIELRPPMQALARAAAVTLLREYGDDAGIKLAVYPGRPRSISPPHAWVDRLIERTVYPGQIRQRYPTVEVIVVHGLFDSLEAVTQKDAFADGFLNWVTDRVHAIAENTTVGVSLIEDVPDFINDWEPPERQRNFYATRITLEGFGN